MAQVSYNLSKFKHRGLAALSWNSTWIGDHLGTSGSAGIGSDIAANGHS